MYSATAECISRPYTPGGSHDSLHDGTFARARAARVGASRIGDRGISGPRRNQ